MASHGDGDSSITIYVCARFVHHYVIVSETPLQTDTVTGPSRDQNRYLNGGIYVPHLGTPFGSLRVPYQHITRSC
mgnify:CR=1